MLNKENFEEGGVHSMKKIIPETPWKIDKGYTSIWNFNKEAIKNINFAKDIKFYDFSLRDGEQQSGLFFNKVKKSNLRKSFLN